MKNRAAIHTENAPKAIGPYSQAIKVGEMVFLSGQIPLDPETMELVSDDFHAQARQVFANLKAVCQEAGGDLQHLVKLNVYLTDLANFAAVNSLMESLFSEPYPARAAVGVAQLPRGAQVEIEGIMII